MTSFWDDGVGVKQRNISIPTNKTRKEAKKLDFSTNDHLDLMNELFALYGASPIDEIKYNDFIKSLGMPDKRGKFVDVYEKNIPHSPYEAMLKGVALYAVCCIIGTGNLRSLLKDEEIAKELRLEDIITIYLLIYTTFQNVYAQENKGQKFRDGYDNTNIIKNFSAKLSGPGDIIKAAKSRYIKMNDYRINILSSYIAKGMGFKQDFIEKAIDSIKSYKIKTNSRVLKDL